MQLKETKLSDEEIKTLQQKIESDNCPEENNPLTAKIINEFAAEDTTSGDSNPSDLKCVRKPVKKCTPPTPENSGAPKDQLCKIIENLAAGSEGDKNIIKKLVESDDISKCVRVDDSGKLVILDSTPDCKKFQDETERIKLYNNQFYKLILASFRDSPSGGNNIPIKKLSDESQTVEIGPGPFRSYLINYYSNPYHTNSDEEKQKYLNILILQEQQMEAQGKSSSDVITFIYNEIMLKSAEFPVDKSKIYLMLSQLALKDLNSGTIPLGATLNGKSFPGDSPIPNTNPLSLALEYGKRAAKDCTGESCELYKLRQQTLKVKVLSIMSDTFSKGLNELASVPYDGPELTPPGWDRVRSWAEYYNKKVGEGYGELLCPFSPMQLKSSNTKIRFNAMLRYKAGIAGLMDILKSGMELKDYKALSREERLNKLSEIYTNVNKDHPLLKKLECSMDSAMLDLADVKALIDDNYPKRFDFFPPITPDNPYSTTTSQEIIDYQLMTSVNAQLIAQKATYIAIAAGLATGATEIYSLIAAGAYFKAGVGVASFLLVSEGFGILHEEVEDVAGDVVADFTDLIAMVGIGYGMKAAHNYFVKPAIDPAMPPELIVKGVSDDVRLGILDGYRGKGVTVEGGKNLEYDLTFKDGKKVKIRFVDESADLSKAYEVQPKATCKDGVDPAIAKAPSKTGCFLADTKIKMADGEYKNIQDIIVGDKVAAFDLENNREAVAPVTATFVREANEYYVIEYETIV